MQIPISKLHNSVAGEMKACFLALLRENILLIGVGYDGVDAIGVTYRPIFGNPELR